MSEPAPPPLSPSILQAGLKGLCPRCGKPTLFTGWIKFANRCTACGLDFAQFNVGDGPAAFLTLILGTLVVGLAVWLQLALSPPWWVHVLIWPAFALAAVVAMLRLAKGALMAAEYQNAAREGRIDRDRP
ncbi:DUF983 domain-containing protein [Sphingomonas sp. CROZ-RG-20F-R02-07]|uniref:DUF983 domain-containing protein n=1 Tax=Sphingomonas sp. CROZ-RG-20F-R02-07 TaxID=2914832 RepID=UPI001F5A1F20